MSAPVYSPFSPGRSGSWSISLGIGESQTLNGLVAGTTLAFYPGATGSITATGKASPTDPGQPIDPTTASYSATTNVTLQGALFAITFTAATAAGSVHVAYTEA